MEDLILLVPNNQKLDIIKKVRKEYYNKNIKFMSLEEFTSKVTFTYNEETLYYLMKEYLLEESTARVYLDNLKYINSKLDNDKMKKLKSIKFFLDNKNLLIYDDKFKEYIKDKKIYIYGYNYINKYYLNILANYNYEVINNKDELYEIKNIYKFNTIEDEVLYVGSKIVKLLKSNIDIKNIKLIYSGEYEYILPRVFKLYNIPLEQKSSIFSSAEVKKVLNDINNFDSISLITNEEIRNKYISVLNKYNFVKDYNEVKDLIIKDLKNTYVITNIGIKNYNINDYFTDEDYVFYLGFNKENIPYIYKDNDYFTDKEKTILSLDTSINLNKLEKESTKNNILRIKNLFLAYKLSIGNIPYEMSDLFTNINIIENENIDYEDSHILNKILLTKKLDKLIKYNIKDKDLELLSSNYDIPYMKYDNNYNKIPKEKLYKYLNNKLLLSYSGLENYNECKFKYYLNNILKLNIIKDDFAIIMGNVCHYVLSKIDEGNFNPSVLFDEYVNSIRIFKDSELFFLSNIKEELLFIIDTIKKQLTYTTFNKAEYEKKVYINYDKNIKVTFMGVIDKLLYKEEDNITYLVVIDYKTGNTSIKMDNMEYGLGMQLPVYLYLSSNIGLNNVKVVGFYLQKLFNNPTDNKKDYLEEKEANLRLEGYSLNNEKILSKFDTTYNDSKLIKSMKTTKDGFYKYSKVLTEEELNNLLIKTTNIINENIDSILDSDFTIDPKVINGNNVSCTYCEYKDICYLNQKNIKYIDKEVIEDDKMD